MAGNRRVVVVESGLLCLVLISAAAIICPGALAVLTITAGGIVTIVLGYLGNTAYVKGQIKQPEA